jgi:transposase-like protein
MDDVKEQLARIKESPSQKIARLQRAIPTTEAESTEPKALEEEQGRLRLDPDIRAQMNVAIARDESNAALSATELAEDDRRQEIYYKVNDPAQFFVLKADDLDRKPGMNDGQYRAYQQRMAKMWTDRFIKTHPEHSKGRIDRLSIHRKRKRRQKMVSKTKGKRYSAGERRLILRWAEKKGISSAAEHYGVSSTTIHNWKTSAGVKTKSNGKAKARVSIKRGSSLSVIRDLAQKLLVAVDNHRAEMASILSR